MPIVYIDGLPLEPIGQDDFGELERSIQRAVKDLKDLGLERLDQVSVVPRMSAVCRSRADVRELIVRIDGCFVGAEWPARTSHTFQNMADRVLFDMISWAHAHDGPFADNKVKPMIQVLTVPFPRGEQKQVTRPGETRAIAWSRIPVYEVIQGGYARSEDIGTAGSGVG